MSAAAAGRKELEEALGRYATDTLTCIHIIRGFCQTSYKWILWREMELEMMRDMKKRLHQKEENGFTAFLSKTFGTSENRLVELEKELKEVLADTLRGLEELHSFLEAVEMLAVTSLQVFPDNQRIQLPEAVHFDHVQAVIYAARIICPLLVEFKREPSDFFLPKMQNIDVLDYQLDRYIQITKRMCNILNKSCFEDFPVETEEVVVELSPDLPANSVQRMLDHIGQLQALRSDLHFRMVFLFQGDQCHRFMKEFSERRPRMLKFLEDLEESAVQLDRMKKGARISSVAGSSVGAVGGVLSIVGLALIPFTAGVSLGLTMAGVGMGVTSGVNSIVTTATELGVNNTQQKKASDVFQSFMEDVGEIQSCLEEVSRQVESNMGDGGSELALGAFKLTCKAGAVAKGIDSIVDLASGIKLLKNEEVISGVAKLAGQQGKSLGGASRLASDIPDVGQAAAKSTLAVSNAARGGLIALNALFLGMDVFFIVKDSIGLANGSESDMSRFLRARAALWSSEMASWEKIHDALRDGLPAAEKNNAVLKQPFYPNLEEGQQPPEEEFLLKRGASQGPQR